MKPSHLVTFKTGVATLVLGAALMSNAAYAADPAQTDQTNAGAPAPGIADGPAPSSLDQPTPAADTGTIVVTGTRLSNPNIKSMSPVTSVSQQDIKLSGKTSAEDLLNQLPQVVASQNSTVSNGATGISTVDLRGLGPNRTMVLINGRRLMPGDPGADVTTGSAADINMIPTALVKRVDVLTGGASATYGADAVAGVVNFVLDTQFTGFKVDFQDGLYNNNNANSYMENLLNEKQAAGLSGYGYPKGSKWDGNGFNGTIMAGAKFADGAGHVMGYFEHRHQSSVSQSQRDYSACTLNTKGTACGGSATSNPANGLYYPAGQGSSTIGSFNGKGTLTAGGENLYNYAPTNYYQRSDDRYNAGLFADYDAGPALHPYFEFMFMADHTHSKIAPSGDFGNTTTINCDNPYLSATEKTQICNAGNMVTGYNATGFPIVQSGDQTQIATAATNTNTAYLEPLWRDVYGGGRTDDLNHQSYRGVLGTNGTLSKVWSYSTYIQYGRTGYNETYTGDVSVSRLTNALDAVTDSAGNIVCASGAAGCSPLNIFSGTPSAAALAYIEGTGHKSGFTSELVANGQLTGDLTSYGIKTPWADTGANVAFSSEFRREGLALHVNDEFSTGDLAGQGGATLPISGSYTVIEGIFEGQLPIIQDKLNIDTGYRFSHYRLSTGREFNTNTYKIGLDFTPIKDIRFRGSFNRAARAPNLQELFGVQHVALDGATDPCTTAYDAACGAEGVAANTTVTANPAGQYNGLIGGNPNLNPEIAFTKTVGIVVQPQEIRGLMLTADYYNIKIKNAIQSYGADVILSACDASGGTSAFCSLIHRAPNGSLWTSTSGYVIDIEHNVGFTKNQGVDLTASYTHSAGALGRITANLDGSVLIQAVTNNGISAAYDCATYYGVTCGNPNPRWKHHARLTLDTPDHTLFSIAWRYIGPVDSDFSSTTTVGEHIGSYSYFDLSVSRSLNKFISARIGVNNLLDRDPPLVGNGACATAYCNGNTYPGTYDALGRYVYAGFTMQL